MAKLPDIDLGEKANAFRKEVREWLAANWDGRFLKRICNGT